MFDPPEEFDPQLIDLHLRQSTSEERHAALQRVIADPESARQNQSLAAIFRALACLRDTPAPPDDLVARIVSRVRQAARPRVVPEPADGESGLALRVYRLRDVLALAAIIVLVVGLGVPSLLHVRERNRLMACSANLSQLGQGLAAYASTFGDSLPFIGWSRGAQSWQPAPAAGVETVPNRRHLYPLLAAGIVRDPARFVCPSQAHVPMPADQIRRCFDFPESRNLSYAYQNMAGVRPRMGDSADVPVMADENPLFDDGIPLLRIGLVPFANSRAHSGRGQNVLTLGGRVRWSTVPDCGVDGDNIWTLRGVSRYTGVEGPATCDDSHLLK